MGLVLVGRLAVAFHLALLGPGQVEGQAVVEHDDQLGRRGGGGGVGAVTPGRALVGAGSLRHRVGHESLRLLSSWVSWPASHVDWLLILPRAPSRAEYCFCSALWRAASR